MVLAKMMYLCIILEHFAQDVEANIRKLLPIRRAAKEQHLKVSMSADSLKMNNSVFNVNNFKTATWIEQTPGIAATAIKQKFHKNLYLKEYLLKTGRKVLVEAAPKDKWWGIGFSVYENNILKKKGEWSENLQGNLLMKERDKLRESAGMSSS